MEYILSKKEKQVPMKKSTEPILESFDFTSTKYTCLGKKTTYLGLLDEGRNQDFIFGIKGNKLTILKSRNYIVHEYSPKGTEKGTGTDLLLNIFVSVLFKTLKCNIKLFSVCFQTELKEAIKKVLDRYNVEVELLEQY